MSAQRQLCALFTRLHHASSSPLVEPQSTFVEFHAGPKHS